MCPLPSGLQSVRHNYTSKWQLLNEDNKWPVIHFCSQTHFLPVQPFLFLSRQNGCTCSKQQVPPYNHSQHADRFDPQMSVRSADCILKPLPQHFKKGDSSFNDTAKKDLGHLWTSTSHQIFSLLHHIFNKWCDNVVQPIQGCLQCGVERIFSIICKFGILGADADRIGDMLIML